MVSLVYPLFFLSEIFRQYLIYFIVLVAASSVYGVLQMYARGTNKVASCAISGVVYTVTLALSNIWLLLLVKMGIPGYLMSTVLAYLVPSIYLFIVVKDKSFNLALLDKS